MKTEVRVCMKEWSDSKTIGTRTYLKTGHSMLQSFTEKDLTVHESVKLAWAPVTFSILESVAANFELRC